MPARGSVAKATITNQISSAFKAFGNYLGEEGGKIYVRAQENGEWLKIAISLTCCREPGAPIGNDEPSAFQPKYDDEFYKSLLKDVNAGT